MVETPLRCCIEFGHNASDLGCGFIGMLQLLEDHTADTPGKLMLVTGKEEPAGFQTSDSEGYLDSIWLWDSAAAPYWGRAAVAIVEPLGDHCVSIFPLAGIL